MDTWVTRPSDNKFAIPESFFPPSLSDITDEEEDGEEMASLTRLVERVAHFVLDYEEPALDEIQKDSSLTFEQISEKIDPDNICVSPHSLPDPVPPLYVPPFPKSCSVIPDGIPSNPELSDSIPSNPGPPNCIPQNSKSLDSIPSNFKPSRGVTPSRVSLDDLPQELSPLSDVVSNPVKPNLIALKGMLPNPKATNLSLSKFIPPDTLPLNIPFSVFKQLNFVPPDPKPPITTASDSLQPNVITSNFMPSDVIHFNGILPNFVPPDVAQTSSVTSAVLPPIFPPPDFNPNLRLPGSISMLDNIPKPSFIQPELERLIFRTPRRLRERHIARQSQMSRLFK